MMHELVFSAADGSFPENLIIPFWSENLDSQLTVLAADLGVPAGPLLADFRAKPNETLVLYPQQASFAGRVFLLGLGDKPDAVAARKAFRLLFYQQRNKIGAGASLDLLRYSNLAAAADDLLAAHAAAATWAADLAGYDLAKFRTEGKETPAALQRLVVYLPAHLHPLAQERARVARTIAGAQLRAMDLVNLPGNRMNALHLAAAAEQAGAEAGFAVQVLHKAEIEQLGLGGLLAVNQGSTLPPTFTVMEYRPAQAAGPLPKIGLAGKGVTFDTGGISIKEATNMGWMKSDMGGAAAVIGAMEVAARLQLPVHLVGVVPATDNKPDGNAIQPGDIIDTYSGLTIEVDDTDAEGRIILADAVSYLAKNHQPDVMIDLATLTGACIFALGYHAAGLMTQNDALAQQLAAAGQRSGDRVWRLPLWDDYQAQIKSDMADVKNYGGRPAGAITAAKLIERFTAKHSAWAHLDIAGTAFADSPFGGQRHATAFGVALLAEYLMNGPGQA
jgi:leucyl aminopeptidase